MVTTARSSPDKSGNASTAILPDAAPLNSANMRNRRFQTGAAAGSSPRRTIREQTSERTRFKVSTVPAHGRMSQALTWPQTR